MLIMLHNGTASVKFIPTAVYTQLILLMKSSKPGRNM